MAGLDPALIRLDRRLRVQGALRRATAAWSVSLLAGGSAALVARLAGLEPAVLPALGLGFLAPLALIPRWWGQPAARAVTAARLDLLTDARGLVMAAAVDDHPAWRPAVATAVSRAVLPPLDLRRLVPVLLAATAAVAVLAVPPPTDDADPRHDARAFVTPLRTELADLAPLLPTPEVKTLEERLNQLEEKAKGGLDQQAWNSLDRLAQDLGTRADQAGNGLAEATDAAQRASLDAAQAPALAAALAQLAQTAPGLLPPTLDPANQAALAAVLQQAAAQGLVTPAQAKLLAERGLTPAGKPGQCNAAQARAMARELAKRLESRCNGMGACRASVATRAGLARCQGRGRGPGGPGHTEDPDADTPIEHQDRARLAGGSAQDLAPGARLNPDGSVTLATQVRTAEEDPAARAALAAAAQRAFDPAAADTRRAAVHPRLAPAVEAYFTPASPERK